MEDTSITTAQEPEALPEVTKELPPAPVQPTVFTHTDGIVAAELFLQSFSGKADLLLGMEPAQLNLLMGKCIVTAEQFGKITRQRIANGVQVMQKYNMELAEHEKAAKLAAMLANPPALVKSAAPGKKVVKRKPAKVKAPTKKPAVKKPAAKKKATSKKR